MLRRTLLAVALGLYVLGARGAGAAEPVVVTAGDISLRFDREGRTLMISQREAGIILFRLVVWAKVGGKDVSSADKALPIAIPPSPKSGELEIPFEKAFVLKAAVREDSVEIRVEGNLEGHATLEGRLCANKVQAAILKDEAATDKGVLVTTLGHAEVPGVASLYDPERDLALTAGPSPAATWVFDEGWPEIRSSAPAGQPLLTLRVRPHYYRDTLGIKYYAPRKEQKRWPTAPVVAMTWYGIEAMKGRPAQTMERLRPEIDWVAQHLAPYAGDNLVFQLDDNYPEKDDKVMREIADYIRSKGLVPGIWFTPYGVAAAGEAEKHPDWFLRDGQGKLLTAFAGISYKTLTDRGANNYVLNTTNADAVKAWFGPWWKKASETWNYDFFKIDGLPSVVDAYRNATNGGGIEGFRKGLEVARSMVGPEKFINGCSGTPVEGIGWLDGCRTGPDTGYNPHAIDVILRWNFLNNLVWWCDPDAAASLYKPEVTLERVRLNAQARALTGQQFLTDDLWTQIPADKRRVWQQSFPTLDIYPVNLYEIKDWHKYDLFDLKIDQSRDHRWGPWDVVGLFNYDGKAVEKPLDLARLPLKAGEVHVYDFWRGVYLGRFARDAKIPMALAAYEGKVFSLTPASDDDRPVLVSTSRHVSQGGLDLEYVQWEPNGYKWIVSGTSSHLVLGDPYELVFASDKYVATAASSAAGEVKLARGGGVVRATFTPTANTAHWPPPGEANWRITFEPCTDALPSSPAFLVFPVTSDEKGLGDQVRLMLRAKARRLGAVVFDPSSVAEALAGETVTLDMPPERLAQLARDRFRADVAVVGHVAGTGPYEVRLRVVYPARPADGRTADKVLACAYHQVIPLEVTKAVYDILGIPIPPDPWREFRGDPDIQRRWQDGPNLVRNSGFEQPNAAGDGPADWQPVEKEMAWTSNPDGPGKVLTYRMSAATAGSYGLDFYSDYIPIEPGAVYRFACRYKTLGPTVKIFLKGYHPFEAQDGQPAQRRETYRRQVHPPGGPGQWHTVEADFVPSATRPEHAPTFLRVDLYAYWPEGVVHWDDVVLKKVRDAPPGPPPAPTDAEPLDAEPSSEAKEMP